jgi:hypothetical protein
VEREESGLYGLPLEEFVPARTELEKRLRKGGDRERAAAVKRLAKPTAAAGAVNQASRCRPKERRALLEASEELRDVQERLLSGDASGPELEAATAKQREAIDGLVEAAAGLLSREGRSLTEATLARVRETFAAVATDTELAELVEAGTLDRERRATGLGLPGLAVPERPPSEKKPKKAEKGKRPKGAGSTERDEKRRRAARERAKAAAKEERDAKERVAAAERSARKAAERVEKRERQLDEARARVAEAEEDLEEARAAAEAAREELEAAAAVRDEAAEVRAAAEDELDAPA